MASSKGLFAKIARRPARRPRKRAARRDDNAGDAAGGVSDAGGRGIAKLIAAASRTPGKVPGPSPNPATNLIIHDIVMRVGGRVMRHTVEKGLLQGRYGGDDAKAIIENRSLIQALVSALLARTATRSVPGAAVIGTGLIAKTLYDRRRSRKAAKRAGDESLAKMAKK